MSDTAFMVKTQPCTKIPSIVTYIPQEIENEKKKQEHFTSLTHYGER